MSFPIDPLKGINLKAVGETRASRNSSAVEKIEKETQEIRKSTEKIRADVEIIEAQGSNGDSSSALTSHVLKKLDIL